MAASTIWNNHAAHGRVPGAQLMSALGQKQTSDCRRLMSALPPKADIGRRQLDVRFVPIADIAPRLGEPPTARNQISGIDSSARRAGCRR
jgi:hypothetical protein